MNFLLNHTRYDDNLTRYIFFLGLTEMHLRKFFQSGGGVDNVKGNVKNFEFESPECFSVVVQCKLPQNDPTIDDYILFTRMFVANFSKITKSIWLVQRAYRNKKTYRKVYSCKWATSQVNCFAKIDIRVFNIDKDKSDCHEKYNITLDIDHKHYLH